MMKLEQMFESISLKFTGSSQKGKENEFRRDWKRNTEQIRNYKCHICPKTPPNFCSSDLSHSGIAWVELKWDRENQHQEYELAATEGSTEEEIFRGGLIV